MIKLEKMVIEILGYVSVLSALMPIIVFFRFKGSIKINAIRVINLAILVSFLTDIILAILHELKISNLIVGNLYAIFFFLILIVFYKNILPDKIEWLYAFIVIYGGFVLVNSVLFQGFSQYQGYSRAFGGVLLIICSLMYFNSLLTNLPANNVMQYGLFWINAGIVFYYSFNLLLFIYSNYVFTHMESDVGMIFWSFHNINNIIKNMLFCVGIYCAGRD